MNDLTTVKWDGKSPHPLSIKGNYDPDFWRERRRNFVQEWKEAEAEVAALGTLYFIQAGKAAVKIGRSCKLLARQSSMQVDNHERLNCLLALHGRGHEEKEWHERYKRQRIHGEWYRLTPTLKKEIEALQRSAWADDA